MVLMVIDAATDEPAEAGLKITTTSGVVIDATWLRFNRGSATWFFQYRDGRTGRLPIHHLKEIVPCWWDNEGNRHEEGK